MMIGQPSTNSQVQHDLKRVLLWLRPDGWQARARRNAWASMVADRQRRNERIVVAREGLGRDILVDPALQAQVP